MKWHLDHVEDDDHCVFESWGFAYEIMAWRFLAHLSERDAIDALLCDLPEPALEASEEILPSAYDNQGMSALNQRQVKPTSIPRCCLDVLYVVSMKPRPTTF